MTLILRLLEKLELCHFVSDTLKDTNENALGPHNPLWLIRYSRRSCFINLKAISLSPHIDLKVMFYSYYSVVVETPEIIERTSLKP